MRTQSHVVDLSTTFFRHYLIEVTVDSVRQIESKNLLRQFSYVTP